MAWSRLEGAAEEGVVEPAAVAHEGATQWPARQEVAEEEQEGG